MTVALVQQYLIVQLVSEALGVSRRELVHDGKQDVNLVGRETQHMDIVKPCDWAKGTADGKISDWWMSNQAAGL